MRELSYIKEINIEGLWGKKDIRWSNIHPDVNILVGINGSGKTTLLNMIDAYYSQDSKELKRYKGSIEGMPVNTQAYPVTYLRRTESPLMQDSMKMLDFKNQAPTIQQNINELFSVINKMFSDTGKTIDISKGNNSALLFYQNNDRVTLEQ